MQTLLLLLGIFFPFLLVKIIPTYGTIDVGVFHTWSFCWADHWRTVYLDCELRPNYPIVGIFLSGGILAILREQFGVTEVAIADQYFRYFLAIFEALNFVLLAYFFQLSRLRHPILIAFLIVILPSTWAGASIWGQIDHVSLTFLLIALIATLKWWFILDASHNSPPISLTPVQSTQAALSLPTIPRQPKLVLACSVAQHLFYGLLIALGVTLYILNKQIALFSFPFLGIIYAITLVKLRMGQSRSRLFYGLFFLGISLLIFRGIDSLLIPDGPYLGSSFITVWAEGSGHGNIISGNGANLWALLDRELRSTSHFPLFTVGSYPVKPYILGIILYGCFFLYLGQSMIRIVVHDLTRSRRDFASAPTIQLLYICCFFHGLTWLGFNVLLTGSHDRHPYIGYIFLVMSLAYFFLERQGMGQRLVLFSGFVAIAYGIFILNANAQLHPLFFAFERNEFIATLQFIWLVVLTEKWQKLHSSLLHQRRDLSQARSVAQS